MGGNPGSDPGAAATGSELDFPDVPRQELDGLLEQLTERAQEVLAAQGRLRALLHANAAVVGELNLPSLLARIPGVVCELVGARRGALGLAGTEGSERLVCVGVDEDELAELAGRPGGVALQVPILLRGRVTGHLFALDPVGGARFTDEDAQLLGSLASTVGVAIENARLYEQSERRNRWVSSSAEVTRMLLAADTAPPMDLIARRAAENAGAVVAMLLRPVGAGRLAVEVAVGPHAGGLVGKVIPSADSLSGEAIRTGKPILSPHPGRLLRELDAEVVRIGPVLAVPLTASTGALGALCLARTADVPAFSDAEMDMVAGFANQAALALELARGRADQESLRTMADHDRIAADLHDHVIQQLFAVGMTLHATAASLADSPQAVRLSSQVDVLDDTIARIRATIYELNTSQTARAPLRNRVVDVVTAAVDPLGFDPALRFTGPVDTVDRIGSVLADDVVAVTREALSNCARHAHASAVSVEVSAADGRVTVEVADDGRGIGTPSRSSGLANLRRRAESHGGTLRVASAGPHGGTRLVWAVPLAAGASTS